MCNYFHHGQLLHLMNQLRNHFLDDEVVMNHYSYIMILPRGTDCQFRLHLIQRWWFRCRVVMLIRQTDEYVRYPNESLVRVSVDGYMYSVDVSRLVAYIRNYLQMKGTV